MQMGNILVFDVYDRNIPKIVFKELQTSNNVQMVKEREEKKKMLIKVFPLVALKQSNCEKKY
jgi:hypothetical protein